VELMSRILRGSGEKLNRATRDEGEPRETS